MIQPKIQEVYTEVDIFSKTQMEDCVELSGYFKEEKLVTFTPEEFEQFKREFGKELLELAANKAQLGYDRVLWDDPKEGDAAYMNVSKVNKESITSVLDDYLKENKI
jgi:hypothetical protein